MLCPCRRTGVGRRRGVKRDLRYHKSLGDAGPRPAAPVSLPPPLLPATWRFSRDLLTATPPERSARETPAASCNSARSILDRKRNRLARCLCQTLRLVGGGPSRR